MTEKRVWTQLPLCINCPRLCIQERQSQASNAVLWIQSPGLPTVPRNKVTLALTFLIKFQDLPSSSVVQSLQGNAGGAGAMGSIPGLGRSPGGGRGNSLHSSCLDRGAWQATVYGVTKCQIRLKQLSMHVLRHGKNYSLLRVLRGSTTHWNQKESLLKTFSFTEARAWVSTSDSKLFYHIWVTRGLIKPAHRS